MEVRANPLMDQKVAEALSLHLSISLCLLLSVSLSPSLGQFFVYLSLP